MANTLTYLRDTAEYRQVQNQDIVTLRAHFDTGGVLETATAIATAAIDGALNIGSACPGFTGYFIAGWRMVTGKGDTRETVEITASKPRSYA